MADETYEQRYFTPRESGPTQTRVLRSEVLIAQLPVDVKWLMYRDVLSVDGRAVTDERGRLERIFRESSSSDAVPTLFTHLGTAHRQDRPGGCR